MLAALLEVPETPEDWGRWAWHNNTQIDLIRQAIFTQFKVNLTPYILFPLPVDAPTDWLKNNQAAHTDFNGVLGLQGHNIEELDFTKPDEVASWVNLTYTELLDASSRLKI